MKVKTSELTGRALDWAVRQVTGHQFLRYRPSTDWDQGGPLIEQHQYNLNYDVSQSPNVWQADNDLDEVGNGPTQLIAAMRAIVSSKLGDEVEIPDAQYQLMLEGDAQ